MRNKLVGSQPSSSISGREDGDQERRHRDEEIRFMWTKAQIRCTADLQVQF